MNSKNNPYRIAIVLILLAAAFLRFYNLGEMSLSNDELSSLARLKYDSYSEMIRQGVYIDFHPAGLQSFLYYWVKIFGDGTFILRLPFVIFSLTSVYMIYKLGIKWYNELTALLASAAFGFLIFTILFTQLARMYSPGVMFSLLTVYFWSDFLFSTDRKKKNRSWWFWILSMCGALHFHYFSFLFVGLAGISGIFFVRKKDLLKYLSGGIISLLTFIPEIPIFIAQLKEGDIGGWLGPPSKTFLVDFFFELFNRSYLICTLIVLFILTGIIFSRKKKGVNRWRLLSISWFFITFLIAYFYSILRHPILMYSTMLFVIPFLLLFIFSFIPEILLTKRNSIITLLIFSIILIYDTIIPGKYFSIKHFGVFREIAMDAENWANKYGVSDVPVVVNVINPDYIDYYFDKMENSPRMIADRIEFAKDFRKLFEITDTSSSKYFSYIWSNSSHPLEVHEIIRNSYPYLIERKNYFNAASYLFSKQPGESMVNDLLFSTVCDFEINSCLLDRSKVSSEQHHSGLHSHRIDFEYDVPVRKKISEINSAEYRYVSFTAWIYTTEDSLDAQLVISFDRKDKPFSYQSKSLLEFNLIKHKWQPVILAVEFPKEIEPDDILQAYFWNPSKKVFFADDLKIEVFSGVDPYKRFTR